MTYRVVPDHTRCVQCKGEPTYPTWWVTDGHGETVSGPHCSEQCCKLWITARQAGHV